MLMIKDSIKFNPVEVMLLNHNANEKQSNKHNPREKAIKSLTQTRRRRRDERSGQRLC